MKTKVHKNQQDRKLKDAKKSTTKHVASATVATVELKTDGRADTKVNWICAYSTLPVVLS